MKPEKSCDNRLHNVFCLFFRWYKACLNDEPKVFHVVNVRTCRGELISVPGLSLKRGGGLVFVVTFSV